MIRSIWYVHFTLLSLVHRAPRVARRALPGLRRHGHLLRGDRAPLSFQLVYQGLATPTGICDGNGHGELLERVSSFCCVPWATLSTIFESRRLPQPENSEKLDFADPLNEMVIFLKAEFITN